MNKVTSIQHTILKTKQSIILEEQSIHKTRISDPMGIGMEWGVFNNRLRNQVTTPQFHSSQLVMGHPKKKVTYRLQPKLLRTVYHITLASLYGIFTNIYHRNQPNVGKYTARLFVCPGVLHLKHETPNQSLNFRTLNVECSMCLMVHSMI